MIRYLHDITPPLWRTRPHEEPGLFFAATGAPAPLSTLQLALLAWHSPSDSPALFRSGSWGVRSDGAQNSEPQPPQLLALPIRSKCDTMAAITE